MDENDVVGILGQVKIRSDKAWRFFMEGFYNSADRQLSELRELLVDFYDRQEEKVDVEPSGDESPK